MALMVTIPRELSALLQPEIVKMVRLGSPHDGGYVAPVAALHRSVSVVSLGLKDDWSFEQAVVKRQPAAVVHSYDPTVTPAAMITSLRLGVRSLLTLRDLTLWGRTKVIVGYYSFFRGKRRRHYREWVKSASSPAGSTSISEVLTRVGHDSEVLLKVDIEGDEYGVLNDFISDPRAANIVGIFVEYHDLDTRWHEFVELQTRLLRNYHLVHVHANNINKVLTDRGIPRVLEMSYLRRGADQPEGLRTHLPLHDLDFPNDRGREDYEFVFAD
jgi:hypothetical protein